MTAIAIVCAKDEASRIGVVLDALLPVIDTLVVDDGSTDGTAEVARARGAHVLRLPQNRGKGQAMLAGVRASSADVVVFVDADLVGLRPDHIAKLVTPVLAGQYGMVVGMRDYGPRMNDVVRRLPLISGERAIRRDILARMPASAWSGYGIETWLNHIAGASGWPIGTVLLDGLQIVTKWEKDGPQGFTKMVDMAAEVIKAHDTAARHATGAIVRAPTPPTLAARGASTEEVMRELSRTIVSVGGPFVRDELWTEEARRHLGQAVGQKLAAPLWALCCAFCTFAFGPIAGVTVAVGALLTRRPTVGP